MSGTDPTTRLTQSNKDLTAAVKDLTRVLVTINLNVVEMGRMMKKDRDEKTPLEESAKEEAPHIH